MANQHFGNLADVFKHLALCQVLAHMRPTEYWESHAGAALYDETKPIPAERAHGIHTFCRLAASSAALGASAYARALRPTDPLPQVPGSPLLARRLLGGNIRRFLLCDTDAASLQSIQQHLRKAAAGGRELSAEALECVQDDGITVLRGAGMLLPEPWRPTTLAFIDPYDATEATAAEITPLELACELANRSIPTLLFYTFADPNARLRLNDLLLQALAKARLVQHSRRFEGALNLPAAGAPTQWGFGLLALQMAPAALDSVDTQLRALAGAYAGATLEAPAGPLPGAWTYRMLG